MPPDRFNLQCNFPAQQAHPARTACMMEDDKGLRQGALKGLDGGVKVVLIGLVTFGRG